jgi:membrane associated rhomboid family serine protease
VEGFVRTRAGWNLFGFLQITPMVRRLLIATFAVWALQIVFGLAHVAFFEDWFALDPRRALPLRPWQLVTYMFLHSAPGQGGGFSPLHILLNMFMFIMFGPDVERALGGRKFLRYYLVCGIAGGVLTLLPPFRAVTVGASGAVLGVLTAFGLLFPDRPVLLFFLPVPAKFVVLFMAIMQLASAAGVQRGISYIAHIGGMAAGYVMIRGLPFVGGMSRRWDQRSRQHEEERRAELKLHMDEILDKINREGRESLTQQEWRTLLEESKRLRKD